MYEYKYGTDMNSPMDPAKTKPDLFTLPSLLFPLCHHSTFQLQYTIPIISTLSIYTLPNQAAQQNMDGMWKPGRILQKKGWID